MRAADPVEVKVDASMDGDKASLEMEKKDGEGEALDAGGPPGGAGREPKSPIGEDAFMSPTLIEDLREHTSVRPHRNT